MIKVKDNAMGRACSTNWTKIIHIEYWCESQKEDIGGWIILKLVLERQDEVVWTGLIWLRIGTNGSSCLVLVGTLAVDLLSTGAAEATFAL
jgi:hypothetical protein